MGIIYVLSDQSRLVLPIETRWSEWLSWMGHFGEYAILAALLWLAMRWTTPWPFRRIALITLWIAALYALSDEVHQSFVPGRMPDVLDWLVDVAGAACALWVISRARS